MGLTNLRHQTISNVWMDHRHEETTSTDSCCRVLLVLGFPQLMLMVISYHPVLSG